MKKITTISLILLLSATRFGQQTEPVPALTKRDYLRKSKHQKTAAWILHGGGTALMVSGSAIALNDAANDIVGVWVGENDKGDGGGTALFLICVAAAGSSIPLFLAAGRNKRKAMEISLNNQRIFMQPYRTFASAVIPSISLKFPL